MTGHRKILGLLTALVPLVALLAIVMVAAGQENGPVAATDQATVLTPAADFVDDGLTAFDYAYDDAGGYTYPITDTATCMQAPVYLPNGATVDSFGGYVYDDDPGGRMQRVELFRVAYQPGPATVGEMMAGASTSNDFASDEIVFVADQTVEHAFVDTAKYIYYAVVCANGGPTDALRLYAVEAAFSQ